MIIQLVQLDGKLPNLPLMRLAAHHWRAGDEVRFRRWTRLDHIHPEIWGMPDRVYASAIFSRSRPLVESLLRTYPHAVVGGTGSGNTITLPDVGVPDIGALDYSLYPAFRASIGFSQRGCRLRCSFCVVPTKEGAVRHEQNATSIWRGDPWPRHLLLLDNDFFGQPDWREQVASIRNGGFRVCFSQGINARLITDEVAEAIGSLDYYDDSFRTRRIYTAWDNRKDEARLFAGLNALVRYGVKPDHVMVYMLIGYWPGETAADRDYRRRRLREFGARPYPMPFARTPELVGFQRWVIGAYDKRFSWHQWSAAQYRPEKLGQAA
jgi:hypothetical protein